MTTTPALPTVPRSYSEVLSRFGNIHNYIRADGTLSSLWEAERVVRIVLPAPAKYAFDTAAVITRITVHKLLAAHASRMYAEIHEAGLWSTLGPYGGGFMYRANRNNASRISLHAFAIAWDWDPDGFPNGSPLKRDPGLAAIMRRYGFTLGEDFHGTKDPMHSQYAVGV